MSMNPVSDFTAQLSRRAFLKRCTLGTAALATLLNENGLAQSGDGRPHFAPKAKRVIYLFQSGAPSQLDLFDPKPGLEKFRGQNLPDSIRQGQRLTGMTAFQSRFPTAPSIFKFDKYGQSGASLSELLPHTAKVVDNLCFIKSMFTEQINHDPAITFSLTGFQLAGRPSMGAWVSYGLGSENKDLPAFVVMVSLGTGNTGDQPLYDRLWAAAFSPLAIRASSFRTGRTRCCTCRTRRALTLRCGGGSSTTWRSWTRRTRPSSGTPKSSRAWRSTKWLIACNRPCRN